MYTAKQISHSSVTTCISRNRLLFNATSNSLAEGGWARLASYIHTTATYCFGVCIFAADVPL